jgi:hypothetical protein
LSRADDELARKSVRQLQACFGRFEALNNAVLEIPDSFYDGTLHDDAIPLIGILERQLTALVDCLYDIMPSISRVRQIYLLRLEQQPPAPPDGNPVDGTLRVSPPYSPPDPIHQILSLDLELAAAIKESLAVGTASKESQASEDRSIMRQITEWEKEITRLKDWSRIFENSLGPSPTPAETKTRIDAFERLVNIGCVFGKFSSFGTFRISLKFFE